MFNFAKLSRVLTSCGLLTLMLITIPAMAAKRPAEINPATEKAIERGLAYLAKTQQRNGSWIAEGHARYPVAMTSLAALALLAGGNTPVEGQYALQVNKATSYLLDQADPKTGLIAVKNSEGRPMFGHGYATLFLGEIYGMVRNDLKRERIREVLIKSVELIGRSQSRLGGWYYTPDSNTDEGAVTITQIQALRSVRNAGIKVPKEIIDKACEYIRICQFKDGSIAYSYATLRSGRGRPAITAAAVAVMYSAGQYEHPVAKGCLNFVVNLIKQNPDGNFFRGHYAYANLYASQAMYLSSEENWKMYYPVVFRNYLRTQKADGSWQGDHVGHVYGTSIALMVMQLPYKRLPILQR